MRILILFSKREISKRLFNPKSKRCSNLISFIKNKLWEGICLSLSKKLFKSKSFRKLLILSYLTENTESAKFSHIYNKKMFIIPWITTLRITPCLHKALKSLIFQSTLIALSQSLINSKTFLWRGAQIMTSKTLWNSISLNINKKG